MNEYFIYIFIALPIIDVQPQAEKSMIRLLPGSYERL